MNDCVIQVRCKSTTLATLVKYRREEGSVVGLTQSTLVREALETIEHQIINKHPEMRFNNVSHAREYLGLQGLMKLNVGNRGESKAFKMLQDESISGISTTLDWGDLSKEDIEKLVREELEKNKS